MLLKLLAHGLGRKDKIRYVQSFIYIYIHSHTHRYTYTYTFIQSHTKHNLTHPQSHTYTHIHSHTYSQMHKDSHRDTDYTIVHEMGEGIRRVEEGRGRKSEYQKLGSGGGIGEAMPSKETSLGLLTVANM